MNTPLDLIRRVRRVLSTRRLTLYQVSKQSAQIFGRSSPYYVPEHFYSALAAGNVTPSIHQFVALSRISNYRLCDWLAIFGFSLDDIPRLQVLLPRRRTVLLDTSIYDEDQWIPWFAGSGQASRLSAIMPLAQILRPSQPTRARNVLALGSRRFLYAKVGREDVFSFPHLAPGSIARVDVQNAASLQSALTREPSKKIFVVETGSGFTCSRLQRIDKNRVALCSASLLSPPVELSLGHAARILGVVDAEIRPMSPQGEHIPAGRRERALAHAPLTPHPTAKLGSLLRASRTRSGLSLREASTMSRSVSRILADTAYFASPGTLSDYERISAPPRHVPKILSLCILYCIGFWEFLRAADLAIDSVGNDPMPDELSGRAARPNPAGLPQRPGRGRARQENAGYLSTLIDQWKEIPLFIHSSLAEITRLPRLSLLDFFAVGGVQDLADPRLANAALVTVNRRLKRPTNAQPTIPPEHSVYMLVTREGGYLCGSCTLDRGILALHRHPQTPFAPVETQNRVDAEIVGQVTAVLRRIP